MVSKAAGQLDAHADDLGIAPSFIDETLATPAVRAAVRAGTSDARVTAIGRRPALDELPVTSGTLDEALVGERESHFRVDGDLRPVATSFYDRDRLPLDEPIAGPAVVFHLDTTTVVPPTWVARADASGNLILTKGGAE
jgi:N-methylhydantoinase A/oxoprolinase/acetone carboxylase beta subunit